MKSFLLLIFSLIYFISGVYAQELRCNVTISHQRIQGANQNLFRTMQSDVYEFMNTRKWTEHKFEMEERLECNIFINLEEQLSSDEFQGTIQVQLKRPVCTEKGDRVAVSRRIGARWRLIGVGTITE